MAQKVLINDIDDGDFIDVEGDDISELQNDLDNELNTIAAEFDADDNNINLFVKVYRVLTHGGGLAFVKDFYPSEFPILEKLRKYRGPGTYEFRVYGTINGKKNLRRKFKTIIDNYNEESKEIEKSNSDIAALVNAMNTMQRTMQEQQQRQQEQYTGLLLQLLGKQSPAQSFDPIAIQNQTIAMMNSMKELFGNNQSAQPVNSMENFFKMIELAKDFQNDVTEGKTFGDVASKLVDRFGPYLTGVMEKMNEQQAHMQANPPGALQPFNNELKNKPPSHPKKIPLKEDALMLQLISDIKMLVDAASRNSDPDLYAELIFDKYPYDKVKEMAYDDNIIDNMIIINSNVANHRPWFENVVRLLRETIEAIEADEREMNVENNLTNEEQETNTLNNDISEIHT